MARRRAPKNTIFGTKESTKKHDLEHGFWHEGEHQKARFFGTRDINKKHYIVHEGQHQTTRCRARCLDKGEQRTKESTKKHNFWHEGEHQKARLLARGSIKKHYFVHEGEHQKTRSRARFFARGKAPKNTILCTKENTQNNVRPKYQDFFYCDSYWDGLKIYRYIYIYN